MWLEDIQAWQKERDQWLARLGFAWLSGANRFPCADPLSARALAP